MKKTSVSFTKKVFVTPAVITAIFLSGCDGEKQVLSGNTFVIKERTQTFTKETTLKGKISNDKTTINSGIIKATDSHGKVITSTELSQSNRYSMTIPANTELPIILSYSPSAQSDEKAKLISVAIHPSIKSYDINPLTTLIAKKAKSLGGYTRSNMSIAADQTVGIPDANKTSTGFRGDPTKQYGGWH